MTLETSQHAWFAERISAYLTDGLDERDRAEFESHAGQCGECAAKLAEAKLADETLRGLFEKIGPAADFEDRVIRKLRVVERPRFAMPRTIRLHPGVIRTAGAVAAIIVLGAVGYNATQMIQNRGENVGVAANVQQIGQAASRQYLVAANPMRKAKDSSNSFANATPGATSLGDGFKKVQGLQPTFGVAADINPGQNKEGENVLDEAGREDADGGKDYRSSAKRLASAAAENSPYKYEDTLRPAAPGPVVYFSPAGASSASGASVPALEEQSANEISDALKQQQMARSMDLERDTASRAIDSKTVSSEALIS
ncbi:MAG TPA: zf-HC2 domain-containing protein, partial [Tepidisphaeraceae bacterium]